MPGIVALIGSNDAQLEQWLASQGMRVISWPDADVQRFVGAARPPDLLVVDLRGRDELPPALATVRRQHPGTGVIVVADRLDPAIMLEAMRAGISEWLPAPCTAQDLEAAVRRVTVQQQPMKMGNVFAFLGAKGGVGTTTVAVNVATTLAKLPNSRTLLIDLHTAYGDSSVYLGADPRFSVLDALDNTHRLDASFFQSLVVKTKAGPDLLASSDHVPAGAGDTHRVRALIDFAAQHYDYVVLDCPRSDTAILEALEPVRTIVIVVNQELATLRNGSRIAGSLRHRFGRNRVVVVVSRFDTVSEIGHDDVERVVGGPVKYLLPNDYRQALAALNKGRPIVLANSGKLAHSLIDFAKSLAGVEGRDAADRSSGFLSRLRGKR